ncbi:ComEA family DNA-binding protein [Desulfurivibrio alkaliphilus]|uniref:Competence protein ComEA helix-hairpin-helix repeat protein n=1 Tax=Desulfurivibrio alkaliphilus (strain DSM 19089 / UNIQEM U267 / AHT2) TaxID=589865 RepID=D6Z6V2_DESAT|nr:ComEA family DNA-binding protein [Desulfurivibrio alkaliphilus]ADH86939.1 competence protein ComEA helix-hairpin-helix repeat protein [Desulfurivibrio alkaliphilus AHT 2]
MLKKIVLTLCLFLFTVGSAFAALNINTADQEQLQSLPGIGPVTAAAIIEYRENNGEFASIEELVQVRGIGSRTLESLRDNITVED